MIDSHTLALVRKLTEAAVRGEYLAFRDAAAAEGQIHLRSLSLHGRGDRSRRYDWTVWLTAAQRRPSDTSMDSNSFGA